VANLVAEYITSKENKSQSKEQKPQGDSSAKVGLERPPTLFHAIDRSSLPPQEKSATRLHHEGATILFAGSETTARLLAHTIFHLLDNPGILQKVKHEVLEATGETNRVADLKTLESLPWLVRKHSPHRDSSSLILGAYLRPLVSESPSDLGLRRHQGCRWWRRRS
jgi:hypothetical protein